MGGSGTTAPQALLSFLLGRKGGRLQLRITSAEI
jgi:hypothetical protein